MLVRIEKLEDCRLVNVGQISEIWPRSVVSRLTGLRLTVHGAKVCSEYLLGPNLVIQQSLSGHSRNDRGGAEVRSAGLNESSYRGTVNVARQKRTIAIRVRGRDRSSPS